MVKSTVARRIIGSLKHGLDRVDLPEEGDADDDFITLDGPRPL
jgi:hypothetical protein